MEDSRPNYGARIKFARDGALLISHKIFSNGDKMIRLVIDTEKMTYSLVDAVTNIAWKTGGENLTNLEVLQRHAKKALKEYLGVRFYREVKKKASDNNGNSGK